SVVTTDCQLEEWARGSASVGQIRSVPSGAAEHPSLLRGPPSRVPAALLGAPRRHGPGVAFQAILDCLHAIEIAQIPTLLTQVFYSLPLLSGCVMFSILGGGGVRESPGFLTPNSYRSLGKVSWAIPRFLNSRAS